MTLYINNGTNSSVIRSDGSVTLTIDDDSKYCTQCSWVLVTAEEVVKEGFNLSWVETGLEFAPPLYWTDGRDYNLCLEEGVTPNGTMTTTTPTSLLGAMCLRVEGEVSIATTTISMVCLVTMVIVYSILPNLHNVPGVLVLCQVSYKGIIIYNVVAHPDIYKQF